MMERNDIFSQITTETKENKKKKNYMHKLDNIKQQNYRK